MIEAPARPRSALRQVVKCSAGLEGWRAELQQALDDCGETHDSFAAALEMKRQHVQRLFDPSKRRPLTADLLERMREKTPAVWRRFIDLHTQLPLERSA